MIKLKQVLASAIIVTSIIGSSGIGANAMTQNVDGGVFDYGLATTFSWGIKFYQYSEYQHQSRNHYTNAMINGSYTGRDNKPAGVPARSETYATDTVTSNNSYYGFW